MKRKTTRPVVIRNEQPEALKPPQVAMLIERDNFNKLPETFREPLGQMIGSFLFVDFCKGQQLAAEEKRKNLLPDKFSAEDYFQLSKDMRLVWRFWTDLLHFAEEQSANNRNNGE